MRKGDTFHGCGFTFENRPHDSGNITKSMAIPISELESKTCLEFFPGLKAIVGREAYERIKSEDPTRQLCWGK